MIIIAISIMTTATTKTIVVTTITTMRVDNGSVAFGLTIKYHKLKYNFTINYLPGEIWIGAHGVSTLPPSCPGTARDPTEPSDSISKASTPV